MPKVEEDTGDQTGALDLWQLKTADLKLRSVGDPLSCLPLSRFTGDLINRQINNVDLSFIKVMNSGVCVCVCVFCVVLCCVVFCMHSVTLKFIYNRCVDKHLNLQ